MLSTNFNRRGFIKNSSFLSIAAGLSLTTPNLISSSSLQIFQDNDNINIVGPKRGYTPQIGTLVSMLNWMRNTILHPIRGLNIKELDFLLDEKSNSIGAMLLHLAATERFYQIHTFEGKDWGDWSAEDDETWSTAMGLGDDGRSEIKGYPLEFYLKKLKEVRAYTLEEFSKRDDDWLMEVDQNWGWGPTNNYCKWFHVCEHESNHNGIVKYIAKRLPV